MFDQGAMRYIFLHYFSHAKLYNSDYILSNLQNNVMQNYTTVIIGTYFKQLTDFCLEKWTNIVYILSNSQTSVMENYTTVIIF